MFFIKKLVSTLIVIFYFSSCSPNNPPASEKPVTKATDSPKIQTTATPLLINYEKQSLGDIDLNITQEKAMQVLTLISHNEKHSYSLYKEGLGIRWDKKGTAIEIYTDHGDFINIKQPFSIDQTPSFQNKEEFSSFLIDLYNRFEKENINCLKEKKCFIEEVLDSHFFTIPKMRLVFTNTTGQIQLTGISFQKNNTIYQNYLSIKGGKN